MIGEGTVIHNNATVTGHTTIGARCQIHPGAVVGGPPQDLKYKGEKTLLEVGHDTIIRECATINTGTDLGEGKTVVGAHNLIMAYAHIAHDCRLEERVVVANAAQLAGHVHVGFGARIAGLAALHQFVRLGRCSFVAGCARVSIDVPPYSLAEGHPAKIRNLNIEGLKRRSCSDECVAALRKVFRLVFRDKGTRIDAYQAIEAEGLDSEPLVREFVAFLKETDRGRHGRGLEAARADVPPEERDGHIGFKEAEAEVRT